MRTLLKVSLLVAALASGTAAAEDTPGTLKSPISLTSEARAVISELPTAELAARLKSQDILLIDVRTEREYEAGHLRGASWIPRGKLEFAVSNMALPADREIVLYCRTGGRAALAARALQDMGYTNVSSLEGGFKQWVEAGNSIFNQHGEIRVVKFEAAEGQ